MWVGAIAIRVVATVWLLAYPRISDSDLTGWDAERFQEIADLSGTPWVDVPVEYPPGTVAIAKLVAADNTVGTNDRIVVLSLAVDLGLAALLRRHWTKAVAVTYLLIGLPLVPAGLLRLDLWAAFAATMALVALRRRQDFRFAGWAIAGALIKVWPVLIIGAAFGLRKTRAGLTAIGFGLIAAVAWLGYAGIKGPQQVLSLRGATGWQLESIGGSLTGLFTDSVPELQNNAYRIGNLSPWLVIGGRVLTFLAIGVAIWRARRAQVHEEEAAPHGRAERVMLASTAAMIVTAPLLSPQFLLWLTPFAAMLWPSRSAKATAVAIAITGFVGPVFGYPNLADTVPALLLLLRDGALVAAVVLAILELDESALLRNGSAPSGPGDTAPEQ